MLLLPPENDDESPLPELELLPLLLPPKLEPPLEELGTAAPPPPLSALLC